MKVMKKNIFLLLGLVTSLFVQAAIPYTEKSDTTRIDAFTCKASYTIRPRYDEGPRPSGGYTVPGNVEYFQYKNGVYTKLEKKYNSGLGLSLDTPGDYTYVVAWGHTPVGPIIINAPEFRHNASSGTLPSSWPSVSFSEVEQYDVYYIHVDPPLVKHYYYLYADIATNQVDTSIYSSIQKEDIYGRQYCGERLDLDFRDVYKNNTKLAHLSYDQLPYRLNLTPGTYTYYVKVCNRTGANFTWIDEFIITVYEPRCSDRIVYTKWDDVMFVDNGPNGGQGTFVEYQWYKEAAPIPGATDQWIRDKGASSTRDTYYVRITDKDGYVLFSCPAMFTDMQPSAPKNPHTQNAPARVKSLINGHLYIQYDDKLYNVLGERQQ